MPDTGSAKTGLVGKSCPVPESGCCPCSQEPPVAAAHNNFFCCPDFVVWPNPCSASAVERRGQYSATIQRLHGLQFLFATGFKNCKLIRQALGFIALTPALQSGNEMSRRKEQIPGLWHFAQLPRHKHSKGKKKKISADVHVLVGWISTAFFWKINSRGKSCGEQILQDKLCCKFRGSLQWAGREMSLQAEWFPTPKSGKSHSYPADMVSNSRSNKKWGGQTWRRESLSFCYLPESNHLCFSWSNCNYLKYLI